MAKYTITHSCGHFETVQLIGKIADRDKKISWLESLPCAKCAANEAQLEDAKTGLPALEGSEKQIAWAHEIRNSKLAELKKTEDFFKKRIAGAALSEEDLKDINLVNAFIAAARQKTEAKWWIDHRTDSWTPRDALYRAQMKDYLA